MDGALLNDRRYSPHLEATRSATFYFSRFSEFAFHDDHSHCIACEREIAEYESPGSVDAGYITLFRAASDAGVVRQWQWVCPYCFADFHIFLGWKLTEGPPQQELYGTAEPAIADEAGDPKAEYARTSWSADDIVGIAGLLKYRISREQAHRFLHDYERLLKKKMEGAAYELIQRLMHQLNLPRA